MISSLYIRIGIVVLSLIVFIGGKYYFHLTSDSPIEQISEEVIKDETGIDLGNSLSEITHEVVDKIESGKIKVVA